MINCNRDLTGDVFNPIKRNNFYCEHNGTEVVEDYPLVSIILRVYNENIDFLQQAIQSILHQSYANFELIIIDDSTDLEVTKYLYHLPTENEKIKYVHCSERLGRVKAMNRGLLESKGAFLALVDSDDIQKPERLETQIRFLQNNTNIDILGSSLDKIDDNGYTVGSRYYPTSTKRIETLMPLKNTVAQPTVMMRKEVIEKIGFYNENYDKCEDYEMWMRAIDKGLKIANAIDSQISYRVSNTIKRDNTNWTNNLKIKIKYFRMNNVIYRITGIVSILLFMFQPSFFKKIIYNIYNKNW